jgi:adenine-specific DNA-methyltransferase
MGETIGFRPEPPSRHTSRRGASEIAAGLQSGRAAARAWSLTIPERQRRQAAWSFVKAAIDEYILTLQRTSGTAIHVSAPAIALVYQLDKTVAETARTLGEQAAQLSTEQACYQLSATYTALVPATTRSALGMYYTPPALAHRLLDMAEKSGIDWGGARVLDPACGGGAFLLPAAMRMRAALAHLGPDLQADAITNQLCGFEIDPFGAWLAQAWLEIGLSDILGKIGGRLLPKLVRVCDTLACEPTGALFDLVIGNPPYGRVALTAAQRHHFARGLFGHANLYGVFTDIALRWTKAAGVIAYVTPTSFLAGEYFKRLRSLLAAEAPPLAVDFVHARKGVFEDVLQETLLATYRKGGNANGADVHHLDVASESSARITHAGRFVLPTDPAAAWLVPRVPDHQVLIDRLSGMRHRLADWGYRVSTGPLVWNRHKDQLRSRADESTFPIIWAEAVSADGQFSYRAEKRGHLPHLHVKRGDEWLKVNVPCVLVQRTTAKEQARRLIAAEMPASFIEKHGAVVVENHLNMIRPASKRRPKVGTAALAAVLNSSIADEAFRCISGSVAVSAFELEALPLPPPDAMTPIDALIRQGAKGETIDTQIRALYLNDSGSRSI